MASAVTGSGVDISMKWANASASTIYNVAKPGTTALTCDQATANTQYPIGIIQTGGVAQNNNVAVRISGVSYAIASAAISIGARVTATTSGQVVTYAKGGTYPTGITYSVGTALTAAANAGELITIIVNPCEASA